MLDQTIETMGEVRLKDVGQVYKRGNQHEIILRKCSFDVTPGKLTVLLGPSGCGKSTLIKLIAGYENPTLGAITIDGKLVQGPGSDRTVVFQETALFPWMTLHENIMFGPVEQGANKREVSEKATKLLAKVGLKGFENKYPDQVSGGMQRRAEVARAFINNPKVMILDEPFRGLDHMSRGLMQEYYSALFEETRMTTLFVTSEVDEAIFLADRIIVLSYKPTNVKAIIDVPLPRPRQFHMLTSETYGNLKEHILGLLYEEALKGFAAGAVGTVEMEQIVEAVRR
ncbi:ABC transporter ATP-binding protein [Sulfuriferula plumbiphila]|uniref:ABC transporter ATP-binding protein n=1 Tax=Sulfuriferula plumbiphila TaxID=171865 RepID=A0A512LDA7_9PROT|nr:ABC transporter ATP-binding protein [Sulfuriferula plumbiphila]BBP04757.1 ABC transporter ATP-binding protein [Sulfuriferula plumbiphila]GEP32121.1 ABC transporter ATP-binding protein [Sulfuriferula plumbiphila]